MHERASPSVHRTVCQLSAKIFRASPHNRPEANDVMHFQSPANMAQLCAPKLPVGEQDGLRFLGLALHTKLANANRQTRLPAAACSFLPPVKDR